MKFRSHILLFSLAIFILTSVGLFVVYAGYKVLIFWSVFSYVIAGSLVFAFALHFLIGKSKLSVKKVLLLTFAVIVVAATTTHSVWTIITPRWSFSLSTDKSTYAIGENVRITASLENRGFITHSFKSRIREPFGIMIIRWGYSRQVWFSPALLIPEETEFTIPSHQSLERTFIWNQTNIHRPEEKIGPGKYFIGAWIESVTSDIPSWDPIVFARTWINITTT